MRVWFGGLALLIAAVAALSGQQNGDAAPVPPCAARGAIDAARAVDWLTGPVDDAAALDRWCRGVGPPVLVDKPQAAAAVPTLDELVFVTWNAHLAEGRLVDLVAKLRSGALTDGRPVRHFVLLVQELFRRGSDVPAYAADARSAYAIKARDADAPDAAAYAAGLGLSLMYVPSMRNGHELQEDRGNGIVSSEPLLDPTALELPFERQRRVTIGASLDVRTATGIKRLNVVNVHLEPLSSPSSLWIFRNPRRRQIAAVIDFLGSARIAGRGSAAGTVLGGDFNTIQGGPDEDAYRRARAWSTSLAEEDRRSTHYMGRIDYLFFRLAEGRLATTQRVDERFGSDHHPVMGRILPATSR
jgi:endonuclease/exonuclease/phosphatase family metal-dependent hydrolase